MSIVPGFRSVVEKNPLSSNSLVRAPALWELFRDAPSVRLGPVSGTCCACLMVATAALVTLSFIFLPAFPSIAFAVCLCGGVPAIGALFIMGVAKFRVMTGKDYMTGLPLPYSALHPMRDQATQTEVVPPRAEQSQIYQWKELQELQQLYV